FTATGDATPGPHATSHVTGGTDVIPDAVTGGSSGLMTGTDAQFVRVNGETKEGAQEKADAAQQAAEGYADEKIAAHSADNASLTTKGHVQLSNSVTSTSEALAATPKAVKTAMDRADAAFQSASDGKTAIANAVNAKGVTASPADSFPTLATKIGQIKTETPITAGNQFVYIDAEEINKTTTTYSKAREVLISKAGTYRVSFFLKGTGVIQEYGKIYVNGQPKGTERSSYSSIGAVFTEDITIPQNSTIEIWLRATLENHPAYLKDFKIGVDTGISFVKRL
ncbi:tail fiber protein, partial [Paenibacillus dakarensis]|uniref:tail fiber protein n=1 Tax=Paenibacillus dakarensis TaxID=1527293 RepID=UPI000AC5CA75